MLFFSLRQHNFAKKSYITFPAWQLVPIEDILHTSESVKFIYFEFEQPKKHVLNFKYVNTILKHP